MKRRSSLSVLIFLFCAAFASAQRLPELATPENYQLSFTPNFTSDNFKGEESIRIRVLKPTTQIVLNSAEIEFQSATITSGGTTQTAKVSLDKEKEMATLAFDKQIAAGPASLQISFTGILNNELRGFYLGKDKDGRKYAVTQFEATDTRRAFPSFDEPAYKATFDVTLIADKGLSAISNGRVISDKPGPGADQHTVKFATTAKMSPYLVAMAVGNFEYIEGSADGIPIRVWGPPGSKPYSSYALEVAEQCMKYYNKYFGIKYPLPKLDLIAVPGGFGGAMENWGGITFFESRLLFDPAINPDSARRGIFSIIAHEMAHQWFGDLVTMGWWDNLWLNEGFASWMQEKAAEHFYPQWKTWLNGYGQKQFGMALDAR
ncbi:MAG TPA: M1 family metallopeptidase, partial [Terriglobales bacterium]|nr:M1 family metallopeptidase [Terriglobales bacterium]